jgi:hypothetical protein
LFFRLFSPGISSFILKWLSFQPFCSIRESGHVAMTSLILELRLLSEAKQIWNHISFRTSHLQRARGWGSMLQGRRSRVRFPMRSLDFQFT